MKSLVLIISFFLAFSSISAQNIIVKGIVTDQGKQSLPFVNVYIRNTAIGTITDQKGRFAISVPAEKFPLTLQFSRISYQSETIQISSITENSDLEVSLLLISSELEEVNVSSLHFRARTIQSITPKLGTVQTSASSGEIENLIKTLPGVFSGNSMSYQYSVRGGNYDENLVYINGIEMMRPQLVQNSQNEGISFINANLVGAIFFSAGGFDAEYGDKLSSVLDIRYEKPRALNYSFQAGLLGGTYWYKQRVSDRLALMSALRYRNTKYLSKFLPEKGDYFPQSFDFQNLIYWNFSRNWLLEFFNYTSSNSYLFQPKERKSDFGTIQEAYNINIYFDGSEQNKYLNLMNAITFRHQKNALKLDFAFISNNLKESLNQDIMAQYWLNELDKELGSETLGDSLLNLGVGTSLNHLRNSLFANLYTFQSNTAFIKDNLILKAGVTFRKEYFISDYNTWEMIDSAGYSLPDMSDQLALSYSNSYSVDIEQFRVQGYLHSEYAENISWGRLILAAGLRYHQLKWHSKPIISPRLRLAINPEAWPQAVFRVSAGLYYQPAFYREIINLNGELNNKLRAQQSIHLVFGSDIKLNIWSRPFLLTSELYYKLMPYVYIYEVNNLKIDYYPNQEASAYAYGADIKLSGEFVPGMESWFSISYLKTAENILNDGHGNIYRPMDQRITAHIFFQDYLPGNESYKVNLNFNFGSGLPYGPPHFPRFMSTGRMPFYEQLDLGISKKIERNKYSKTRSHFLYKNIWLSAEVYNLFDANNVIGYYWVNVAPNQALLYNSISQLYPVPNYAVGRMFNVKMQIEF